MLRTFPSCYRSSTPAGLLAVTRPLDELWSVDLSKNSIAAVEDYLELVDVPGFMDNRASRRFSLTGPGFNAGVMLIDLARVRREGTFQKTMLWLAENRKLYKPPPVGDSSRRS